MEQVSPVQMGVSSPSTRIGRNLIAAAMIGSLLALSACASGEVGAPNTAMLSPAPAVTITVDDLVGNWGLGSFRNEADLARTTDEARRFCNNPYIITRGPTGGVMMYLADQTQPTEVFVKTAAGRVYIGPPGPAGVIKDRQVNSFQNGVMVAAWVDPTVTARYGTMVFVKCADGTSKPPARAAVTRSAVPAGPAPYTPPTPQPQ